MHFTLDNRETNGGPGEVMTFDGWSWTKLDLNAAPVPPEPAACNSPGHCAAEGSRLLAAHH
jgi:hypothetical protein